MQIDKNQIIQLLMSLGRGDDADRARSELPDSVDSDRDAGLLSKFGLDPSMLSQLTGGGGGGAGDLLGKAQDMFKG
jgi:hypothetical protein